MDLFIDHIPGETRAVLVHNDNLHRLFIVRPDDPALYTIERGSLFKGRVTKVVPSLQAAFVDLGSGPSGYLPATGTAHKDISQAVREGETIIVQVRRDAQGDKGPLLSQKIELPSDHLVLTPQRKGLNISRKIGNPSVREDLNEGLAPLLNENWGLVVRTEAQNCPIDLLKQELVDLTAQWQKYLDDQTPIPCRLSQPPSPLHRLAGLLEGTEVEEVHIQACEDVALFSKLFTQAQFHDFSHSLFQKFGLDDDIEALKSTRVSMAGGGDLLIEKTQALVAIDVNQGARQESRNVEDNALRTNREAAQLALREIQKRNLSGQIVIDFITLKSKKARDTISADIKIMCAEADITFHGLTRLGLGEFSRSRSGTDLGTLLADPQSAYHDLLRTLLMRHGQGTFSLTLSPPLFQAWTNAPPKWLEERLGFQITVTPRTAIAPAPYDIQELNRQR